MPVYGAHKQFKTGTKTGMFSISPAFFIEADNIECARLLMLEHEKYKKDLVYKVLPSNDIRNDEKAIKNLEFQDWKISDNVWIRLNPYEENEPFVAGIIKDIVAENDNILYHIWVTGPYASWRVRIREDIFKYPPNSDMPPKVHSLKD